MLKDDIKKDSRIKKTQSGQKERENALSAHFSTILLISHYLHQTKLEMRRCFQ